MTRDPRRDPAPGDCLERDVVRLVLSRDLSLFGETVSWEVVGLKGEKGSCGIATWRLWARGARVLEKAREVRA